MTGNSYVVVLMSVLDPSNPQMNQLIGAQTALQTMLSSKKQLLLAAVKGCFSNK